MSIKDFEKVICLFDCFLAVVKHPSIQAEPQVPFENSRALAQAYEQYNASKKGDHLQWWKVFFDRVRSSNNMYTI